MNEELLYKNQMGTISSDELELLDQLVHELDRLHLRKAHAYAPLKERGHQFNK
ncbi:hypothetical protein KFU94_64750 [Chloroflexi bacterium TSY]|nr:hypothetical protein [Chloroflexi bacterium TSY]